MIVKLTLFKWTVQLDCNKQFNKGADILVYKGADILVYKGADILVYKGADILVYNSHFVSIRNITSKRHTRSQRKYTSKHLNCTRSTSSFKKANDHPS